MTAAQAEPRLFRFGGRAGRLPASCARAFRIQVLARRVIALFSLSIVVEERIRRRDYAPERR